jgi:putative hydrolase of HD superfamily
LWDEFESRQTIESRFASALDRFIPQLHNYHTQGRSWKEHGITADRVLDRNACIADGSSTLWEWAEALLNDAVDKGFLQLPK